MRRKTKLPNDIKCTRPVHTINFCFTLFEPSNRPHQPDTYMDLEAAIANIDALYNSEGSSLEELCVHLETKRMADELVTRKKRHHTAKIHIRTHELKSQSGQPHHSPPYKQEKQHAYLLSHFVPMSHPKPTLFIQSHTTQYKGTSPPQSQAPPHKTTVHHRNLHITFYPTSQITLTAARQTPQGRDDGPRRTRRQQAPRLTTDPSDDGPAINPHPRTKDKQDLNITTKLIQKLFHMIYHLHPFTIS